MIRADSTSFPTPSPTSASAVPALGVRRAHEPRPIAESPGNPSRFRRRRRFRPGRGRAEGQGRAIPCSPPAPASRCSTRILRRDPPAAGALRSRLALQSAAASARILRLNADASALRDLRFAATAEPLPAAKLLAAVARAAGRPPSLDARRLAAAAGLLDFPSPPLTRSRKACRSRARAGDPVSAAAKAAAVTFCRLPGRPGRRSRDPRPLGVRSRPRAPAALAAARAADRHENLGSRSEVGRGRAAPARRPGLAEHAAAGAIALAAASALDLAADLARRAETLIAVAPKLRAKPAQKIVDLLLAQDCVAPAEAARHAPMTDRAARRLFDRLVALGAARELSGRPAFRLYGL